MLATESPGTGVGASDKSMMPNGIPNRRAASRPTNSPARESLNESFLMISANSCSGRSAAACLNCVVHDARTGDADVNNRFRFADAVKGAGHERIVFN